MEHLEEEQSGNLYPRLLRWMADNKVRRKHFTPAENLVWQLARSMTASDPARLICAWNEAIDDLINDNKNAYEDFLAAEDLLILLGVNFMEVSVEIAEKSLTAGLSDAMLATCERAADATAMVSFRFLAAWLALNSNELERCIDLCEKVEQPFSAIYTLHGQALIESLQPAAAIEVLEAATSLSPQEILAWFQLAKAYDINEQPEEAWRCLQSCLALAPQNLEIATFMAIVSLHEPSEQDKQMAAWNTLWPHRHLLREKTNFVVLMADLSFALNEAKLFQQLIEVIDWQALYGEANFMRALPKILRQMHQRKWLPQSVALLAELPLVESSC